MVLLGTRSRIRRRMVLVHVACRSLGIGTKVQSPEDPVAQKESAHEKERHKATPGTVEADTRHRDHSTVQYPMVS
jgi:hypothetical protein